MNAVLHSAMKASSKHLARVLPQARYKRSIFVLSHMRAATTALTNVLCSHPAISGYGEAHVNYDSPASSGQLLVNLLRRRAFDPFAPYLADKLLHNRLDNNLPEDFFSARAVFIVRSPAAAIASITALGARTGVAEGQTPETAALYYAGRLEHLNTLWDRFAPENRYGLAVETLLADPDARVARLGTWLGLSPALKNEYAPHPASQSGGGGDPTRSADLRRIEKAATPLTAPQFDPRLSDDLRARCEDAHKHLLQRF
ncbi:hypothetical protein TRM7557_02030 [Tritonibacter multivorans]|uniref:Sulfotransferase family protein n=1 Tax=Tritonibacter multivorans TaxID=928856 RepID=A0A0P1GBE7_9RHOB|nr:sulfotransferase [Tritonibacter multivorans]MDA7421971.1 sulfotransferase [Tritonibacter multivorans]CUH78755.1 hypothetical protein TRM7557_02030 [Tritonibacter multivorans]SFD68494.1 Sulfotransferase family protein [Tritonibacter multivorans]